MNRFGETAFDMLAIRLEHCCIMAEEELNDCPSRHNAATLNKYKDFIDILEAVEKDFEASLVDDTIDPQLG